MKQGTASHSGSGATKTEPISHAVNVETVADIGLKQRYAKGNGPSPLYEGRGLKAPMVGTTTYPKGSQR
jgi:hypothetical protein